jgi:hypothetical protein
MDEKNLPTTISDNFPEDFSDLEKKALKKFKEEGLPGISSVPYETEKRMYEMYMEGYNYQSISLETRQKKVFVLALADRQKWLEKRNEKMEAMAVSVYSRKDIFLSENQNFLINFCDSIKEYYTDKIRLFKNNKDPLVLQTIDPKLMNLYLKCLETLYSESPGKSKDDQSKNLPQHTLVNVQGNLNVGENKTNSDDLGKVLKALADLNRVGDNNQGEKK